MLRGLRYSLAHCGHQSTLREERENEQKLYIEEKKSNLTKHDRFISHVCEDKLIQACEHTPQTTHFSNPLTDGK